MKIYKGYTAPDVNVVTVDGKPLPLRLDLRNHSPTGFSWGYNGSGPAQLALAILADHLGSDAAALSLYQGFKFLIMGLQGDDGQPLKEWVLSSERVEEALGTAMRKTSPTWPIVGTFAMEMERQLRLHADRGDRPGWMAVAPVELIQAVLEQATMASDIVMAPVRRGVALSDEKRHELLRRCAHVANFAMMTADALGALPEERRGNRMLTTTEAAARQSILLAEIERFRRDIRAERLESTEDALLRYTSTVRLAVAKELENYAARLRTGLLLLRQEGVTREQAAAAVDGAASYLRNDLDAMGYVDSAPADAVSRWKDAERQRILKSVDGVVRSWWNHFLGDQGAHTLESLLAKLQAIDLTANDTLESDVDILNRRELDCLSVERRWGRIASKLHLAAPPVTAVITGLSLPDESAGPEVVQDEEPRPDGDDPDSHQPADSYEPGNVTPGSTLKH